MSSFDKARIYKYPLDFSFYLFKKTCPAHHVYLAGSAVFAFKIFVAPQLYCRHALSLSFEINYVVKCQLPLHRGSPGDF